MSSKPQTECKRCGVCCAKGGPALHLQDLSLVRDGYIDFEKLITIRAGEPVFSPLSNQIEPSLKELIKISGSGSSWICAYFHSNENSCAIYQHRPLECRTLKCWDTDNLTSIIYQETLGRKHILADDDPLWPTIERHEQECSYGELASLATSLEQGGEGRSIIRRMGEIINHDLAVRSQAAGEFNLSLAAELLYFGRPLFKSLTFYRVALSEGPGGIEVVPARGVNIR